MIKPSLRFGILLGLVILFLINLFYLLIDPPGYYTLLVCYLSPDHHLNSPANTAKLVLTGLLAITVFWWLATGPFVRTFYKAIKQAPVIDKSGFVITVLLLLSFLLHIALPDSRLINLLYMEDQFFETVTVLCALAAAAFLFASIRNRQTGWVRVILLLLAGLFFLFAMEEISWGQRIFGWSTPQALKGHNYQQEANLHNFFNPLFKIAYPLFNLLISMGLFLLVKYKSVISKRLPEKEYLRLLPVDLAPIYAPVFLLLFLQSCIYNTELTEEVVAVFGLSYAIRQNFKITTSFLQFEYTSDKGR